MKIVSWFSCGAASAVATRQLIHDYGDIHEIRIVRIHIEEEHEDNNRFSDECENWFNREIETVKSDEYSSCEDVWTKRRYMSGISGAPCTTKLKSDVRRQFQMSWRPDVQAFGFTFEEQKRADTFRANNPEVGLVCPLIRHRLTKDNCFEVLSAAGIRRPTLYDLGFRNNNCIGCVKSTSPSYWQNVRDKFPDVFAKRAALSRDIGARLVRVKGERVFLDELPYDYSDGIPEQDIECSILCVTEEDAKS